MEIKNSEILQQLLKADDSRITEDIIEKIINKLNIRPNYPIILVGGTNGKGSTCAYLTNILTNAGYKTGTFTSPHVLTYNERICIDREPIPSESLIRKLKLINNYSKNRLGIFKAFTLASHLYFIENNVDIAIIEVGIGGKNDITNLFEPTVSVITTIDYDHCHILGNSLDEIALQKAGILRTNKNGILGINSIPQTLINYAKQIKSNLLIINNDFDYKLHENSFDVWCGSKNYFSIPLPSLRGINQIRNATLAIAALTTLNKQFPISIQAIKTGITQTHLLGRFQLLPGLPQILLDVAHNPESISNMLENMLKLPFAKHSYAILGIALDKDISGIIKLCIDSFDKWFIAPIKSSTRNITNEKLQTIMQISGIDKNNISTYDTIEDACKNALAIAKDNDRIVCFGSFLVVEEAYNTINLLRN